MSSEFAALAGGFFTTEPPGKPITKSVYILKHKIQDYILDMDI